MRLLIVNPNTSPGVTRRIDAAAQAAARPGDRFVTVPAAFGPELIVTPEDTAGALEGVLAAVDRNAADADGIVLASFGDTGIDAVRARTTRPVAGIAHAALTEAASAGRFAIVSFSPSVAPSLAGIVDHYGLTDHLDAVHVLPDAQWSDPGEIQVELRAPLLRLCQDVAARGGIDAIVLGGGPLAGLARQFQPEVAVPLVDGTTAAIAHLRRELEPAA
jgi:Asp/Glu/hydantoin racemase